jgi:hypothetical protein
MKNKKSASRVPKTKSSLFAERISTFLTIDRIFIGGSVIATAVIIGVLALSSFVNRPIDIVGVERISVIGSHVETPVDYPRSPPAGGLHYPIWQNCGIYEEVIASETAVHSLEHGAVWITYRSDLPPEEVEMLRAVVRQGRARLLSPYPDLPARIVVTSWGFELRLEQASDPRLAQFARQYERNTQYAPEANGICVNGESRSRRALMGT